jgi:predicted DNA binding protein
LTPTLETVPGLALFYESLPTSTETGRRLFVAAEHDVQSVTAEDLEADPTVEEAVHLAAWDGRKLFRITLTRDAVDPTEQLIEMAILPRDVHSDGTKWAYRLQPPSRDALIAFRQYCDRHGVSFAVSKLYPKEKSDTRGDYGLTETQAAALRSAYEAGYFEDPRDVTLQELAEMEDVSSAALGRRQRRAMAKLVDSTLFDE